MRTYRRVTWIMNGLFAVLCIFSVVSMSVWTTHASSSKFWFWKDWSIQATQDVTIWWMKNNGNGSIKRNDALLDVIKWWVNWVLWIMALIALGFVIFWWIKMVTARWEEGPYSDGMKIIQRALLWLLIIGVSWFIISAIFWLMRLSWQAWLWWANTNQ